MPHRISFVFLLSSAPRCFCILSLPPLLFSSLFPACFLACLFVCFALLFLPSLFFLCFPAAGGAAIVEGSLRGLGTGGAGAQSRARAHGAAAPRRSRRTGRGKSRHVTSARLFVCSFGCQSVAQVKSNPVRHSFKPSQAWHAGRHAGRQLVFLSVRQFVCQVRWAVKQVIYSGRRIRRVRLGRQSRGR